MPVDTAALRIAINRSKQAEPSDALGHLDHALRSAISDLISELGRTTNSNGAMAIANLMRDHIEALQDLQTMARVRASAFISRDPFGDDV